MKFLILWYSQKYRTGMWNIQYNHQILSMPIIFLSEIAALLELDKNIIKLVECYVSSLKKGCCHGTNKKFTNLNLKKLFNSKFDIYFSNPICIHLNVANLDFLLKLSSSEFVSIFINFLKTNSVSHLDLVSFFGTLKDFHTFLQCLGKYVNYCIYFFSIVNV